MSARTVAKSPELTTRLSNCSVWHSYNHVFYELLLFLTNLLFLYFISVLFNLYCVIIMFLFTLIIYIYAILLIF